MDADSIVQAFRAPAWLLSRRELIARPSPIPAKAGVYGWYFDTLPHPEIPGVGTVVDRWSLLYIGIAPGRPGSASDLRKRLRNHLTGNARGSTLRLSLGSLLAQSLGLVVTPASGKVSFGATEALLSEWLDKHARVHWVEHPAPWAIEGEVVRELHVPLNRDHNQSHPFYPTMGEIRRSRRHATESAP